MQKFYNLFIIISDFLSKLYGQLNKYAVIADMAFALIIVCGIVLMSKGKLIKNKTYTVIISLTVIPILIFFILAAFTYVLFKYDSIHFGMHLFIVETIVLLIYLISKCLTPPDSKLSSAHVLKNSIIIDKSLKMLFCAIYLSLIILLLFASVFAALYYISPDHSLILYPILLCIPILNLLLLTSRQLIIINYLIIIAAVLLSVLIALQLILMVQAAIRLAFASNIIKNYAGLYIVLLLFPALKYISCIILIIKARKELKNKGYAVGVFGAKKQKENEL